MRRLLVWTFAAAAMLSAGGQPALAKEGHEDPRMGATGVLSPIPRDLEPGRAWNATITFYKDGRVIDAQGFSPRLTLTNIDTGQAIGVAALSTRPGVYSARVVLPSAGRWTIAVHNGFDGRVSDLTTFRVSPSAPSPVGGPSFPVWAWIMSGLVSLLVVGGAFKVLPRVRRKDAALLH